MLLFAKIAVAVVASVTSLMGIWQTANVILELQPYLNLPSTPTYLNLLRLGLPNSFFQSTAEAPASLVRAKAPLCPPFDIPPMLWAQSCSSQDESLWVHANPDLDQHIASHDQLVLEKLAYLNTILDYLFSFVEKRPTSAMEVLMFSLVAVLVVACVFSTGTSVYWCLRFIDLRGHQTPSTTASLPNAADITLSNPTIECDDVLPILSDPLQPEPASISEPDENTLISQELVANLTKLVFNENKSNFERWGQQHNSLEGELRAEITKMIEENKSEAIRVLEQSSQLKSAFQAELKDAIEASTNSVSTIRKDLGSDVQSKLESFIFKFDAKLNSKANDDSLLRLETKLGKIIAIIKTDAQAELESAIRQSNNVQAEALTKVGTTVSDHDAAISEALKDLNALKSSFKMLEEGSAQQCQENVILKQRLEKSDSICEDLKAKVNNVEISFQAKLGKLEAGLKSTINDLESKTQDIEVTIGEQQTDLKKMQAEVESQAANVGTTKKLANSKADFKDFKELEKQFSGCVKTHQLNNLSEEIAKVSCVMETKASTSALEDVRGAIERKLTKVGGEIVNIEKAVGSKAEQTAKVEREVVSVQQALAGKSEEIAKVDKDVVSIQEVLAGKAKQISKVDKDLVGIQQALAGRAEQIAKVDKDVVRIEEALAGKADGSEVESLKLQIADKVDATEWATADKLAKEGLLDLSAKFQARFGSPESQHADKAAQLIRDSAKTPVVRDQPVESVHQPADGKSIASERPSNFHEPTLKVDPVAAAKGKAAMLESRWAPPKPPSSTDNITNPTISTTPETSEAANPSNTLSGPDDAQTREILRLEQVDGSSKPFVSVPQDRISPASADVSASRRVPQNSQHTYPAAGPKSRNFAPQVQSAPSPNGLGASRWGNQNVQQFAQSIDRDRMSPVRHFQMASPSNDMASYGTPQNGQSFGPSTDWQPTSQARHFQMASPSSGMVPYGTPQNGQPFGRQIDRQPMSSVRNFQMASLSGGIAPYGTPRNGQPFGSPTYSTTPSGGLTVPQGAYQNFQFSGSLAGLKSTSLAPGPPSMSMSMSTPISRSTSTGLGVSQWAHEDGQQSNQVMSQQDRSNGGPVSSFPRPEYSAKQLALQNPMLTVEQRLEIAANPNTPESLALMQSRSSPASPSAIALPQTPSPMDMSRSNHLAVGMAQIPTQSKAMTDTMASPVPSSEAKGQNILERSGPGPHGGKVVLTEKKILHNRKSRTRWKIKKVLSRFTPQQQQHARYYQDRQTDLFQPGCPWEWLNSLVTNQARDHWIEPPMGWSAPMEPPPGPSALPASESPSDSDEPAES